MTYNNLTALVRRYEQTIAPGSESGLWGDYCEDVRRLTGALPYEDSDALCAPAPHDVTSHWIGEYSSQAMDRNQRMTEMLTVKIGDRFISRSNRRKGVVDTVVDKYITKNRAGKIVRVTYRVVHEYMGQKVFGEVPAATILMGERLPCSICAEPGDFKPSHNGSEMCESGSIASGGDRSHCSCDVCF